MSQQSLGEGLEAIEVHARARRGARLLLARFIFVQATSLVVGILLARKLGPAPFGRLALASAVVTVFNLIGDLGLGAAFIRKPGTPDREELSAAFTVQLGAGVAVGCVVLLFGHGFERLVWGDTSDTAVLAAIVLGILVVAPFRGLPLAALERNLRFGRITAIEIVEHGVYSAVALLLAYAGHGVTALAVALLARSVIGAVLAFGFSPLRPRLTLHLAPVRSLLSFGVAYQTMNAVYVLNGLVGPLLVGRFAGDSALGLVLWAQANAERPKPLLEIIARVAFPSYSRLGATPEVLQAGLERSLHGGMLPIALYGGLLGGCAPLAVSVLYTDLWLPGVPMLYVFLAVFPVAAFTILLDVVFLAKGRSDWVRNFHIVRLVLYWSIAILATRTWGGIGYALAYGSSLACFAIVEVWWARPSVSVARVVRAALGPMAATVATALTSRLVLSASASAPRLVALAAAVGVGGIAFLVVELLIDRRRWRDSVGFLLRR